MLVALKNTRLRELLVMEGCVLQTLKIMVKALIVCVVFAAAKPIKDEIVAAVAAVAADLTHSNGETNRDMFSPSSVFMCMCIAVS